MTRRNSELSRTVRDPVMDILPRVVRQSGIMRDEAKLRQHLRDQHSGRLLAVHTDSKRLRTPEEEERVERSEGVPNSIYYEGNFLHVPSKLSRPCQQT